MNDDLIEVIKEIALTPYQHTYQGRPISLEFHGTPQLWCAVFKDEYDGAPDAGFQPMGFGKTKEEAVADLIERDQDGYCECGAALNGEKEHRDGICRLCL